MFVTSRIINLGVSDYVWTDVPHRCTTVLSVSRLVSLLGILDESIKVRKICLKSKQINDFLSILNNLLYHL